MHERIAINPKICHGQACVKGTRIPVHQIFRMLASGDSVDSLLRVYPTLQREDVLACFDYAAPLPRRKCYAPQCRRRKRRFLAEVIS